MKIFLVTALSVLSLAAADVPRKAPAFSVSLPGNRQLSFSQYAGKVICVEFLYTTCPHCQHASQLMNKLQAEYGSKGLQAIGVAFNDMAAMLVPDFVRDYKITYPVGWSSREPVHAFLQNNPDFSLHVPQIVLIGRKGVIRMQSQPRGDATTATEPNLRQNIEKLLAEPGPAAPRKTSRAKRRTKS